MNAPGGTRAQWLVIGGPISDYTYELFRSIQASSAVDVRFAHDPIVGNRAWAHEQFDAIGFRSLRWRGAPLPELARFIVDPAPDVVFLWGTTPRLAMSIAMARLPRKVPMLFVSDANIADLAASPSQLLGRLAAYSVLSTRVDGACCLGLTNRLALQTLGIRSVFDVPMYSVDFEALDRSREDTATTRGAHERLRIVVIARLIGAKNLAPTLSAIARRGSLASRLTIEIVGDGPLRDELEAIVRESPHLDANFLGALPRARIGSVLGNADGLLLPSIHEPWGIVVVEALGMGVPVIATPAVGAAVSLAGNTQAVVLSADDSGESIADALESFESRRTQLKAAAEKAATSVRKHYGRRRVAHRLIELVEQLRSR